MEAKLGHQQTVMRFQDQNVGLTIVYAQNPVNLVVNPHQFSAHQTLKTMMKKMKKLKLKKLKMKKLKMKMKDEDE